MNIRHIIVHSFIIAQFFSLSNLEAARQQKSSTVILHRHLKKAKIKVANDDHRYRVLHLERSIDNLLSSDNPIKVSVKNNKIVLVDTVTKRSKTIQFPSELQGSKGPHELHIMEHGEHGHNGEAKQYIECSLPCTLQLKK